MPSGSGAVTQGRAIFLTKEEKIVETSTGSVTQQWWLGGRAMV